MSTSPPTHNNYPTKYTLPGTKEYVPGFCRANQGGPDFWFHMIWYQNHGSDSYFHVPHIYTINLHPGSTMLPRSRGVLPWPNWSEVHPLAVKTGKWLRMEDRFLKVLTQEFGLTGDEIRISSQQTSFSEACSKRVPSPVPH
jgi:hypothetical protein